MRKRKSRAIYTFLIPLVACAAFLVGAVKLWGIPAESMLSGLLTLLILMGGLVVAALLTVVVFKLIRRGRDD